MIQKGTCTTNISYAGFVHQTDGTCSFQTAQRLKIDIQDQSIRREEDKDADDATLTRMASLLREVL